MLHLIRSSPPKRLTALHCPTPPSSREPRSRVAYRTPSRLRRSHTASLTLRLSLSLDTSLPFRLLLRATRSRLRRSHTTSLTLRLLSRRESHRFCRVRGDLSHTPPLSPFGGRGSAAYLGLLPLHTGYLGAARRRSYLQPLQLASLSGLASSGKSTLVGNRSCRRRF